MSAFLEAAAAFLTHRRMRWLLDARGRLPDRSRYHGAGSAPDAGN
jgi:hypothetical protein